MQIMQQIFLLKLKKEIEATEIVGFKIIEHKTCFTEKKLSTGRACLFRSKNCPSVARFRNILYRIAKRPQEKLRPTSFQLKGQKAAKRLPKG